MTPGPVSDSYDPEFGTAANGAEVSAALRDIRGEITLRIGPGLRPILEVVEEKNGMNLYLRLSVREWRLVRFAIDRALETLP